MVVSQSDRFVTDLKKKKIIAIVDRISKRRGFLTPSVNFDDCEEDRFDQIAHYHPDSNTICFPKRSMQNLSIDELEKVAVHEITHVLVHDHGSDFKEQEGLSGLHGWSPPGGVYVSDSVESQDTTRNTKSTIDKIRCNYHLCRKKRKLFRCKYCRNYFCSEHISPKPPTMFNPEHLSREQQLEVYKDKNGNNSGHPCTSYVAVKDSEEKKLYEKIVSKASKEFKQPEQKKDFEKDYQELFNKIIVIHLHDLVEKVSHSIPVKIFLHEWVLGVERNWAEYYRLKEHHSEFIPRLSFWIGGLRDKFIQGMTKEEVIEELYNTFDASTYCYFEYGARPDILEAIENYCNSVDVWMGENILRPKLLRFRLCSGMIPLITETTDFLESFGKNEELETIKLNRKIDEYSILEKEFKRLLILILNQFVKTLKHNREKYYEIQRALTHFIAQSSKMGYDILTPEIKEEIDLIKPPEENPKEPEKPPETPVYLSCPKCNKDDKIIPVLYGYPTKKSIRKAERGEIKLGGCVYSSDSPKYYCVRCKTSFGRVGEEGVLPTEPDSSLFERILKTIRKPLVIALICIIIAFLIASQIHPKSPTINETVQNTTRTIMVNKTITVSVPEKISIEQYTSQPDAFNNQEISVKGYLAYLIDGTQSAGTYVYYIKDDYGRKIKLQELSTEQKILFVKGTSIDVYLVSGTFNKRYSGNEIKISNIVLSQKEMIQTYKQITVEENVTI